MPKGNQQPFDEAHQNGVVVEFSTSANIACCYAGILLEHGRSAEVVGEQGPGDALGNTGVVQAPLIDLLHNKKHQMSGTDLDAVDAFSEVAYQEALGVGASSGQIGIQVLPEVGAGSLAGVGVVEAEQGPWGRILGGTC
ncbi:MAG: hypothetical protein FRX49_00770 [Trebouxia sp. A1-2]|nr:MAG: hypothetical protein FRX49_00770 [Trebouxia sp. A1-2]